jgi:hypothetical protein
MGKFRESLQIVRDIQPIFERFSFDEKYQKSIKVLIKVSPNNF